jgi:hypothetical protein
VLSPAAARSIALALPEATEQDHHGIASYRIRGKIFATVPDDGHIRVMVDEVEIRACAEQDPSTFEPVWWGSRLSCIVVDLARVDGGQLAELLADAWRRKAPRTLVRAHEQQR